MYISEEVVREHLRYEALIPAIGAALTDWTEGRVEQPARTILRAGNAEGVLNGWFAVMPVIAGDVMGVKTVTFYPGNAAHKLPTHMAVVELLRRATGEPLAVMDGRLITEMRTAAVSAVAFMALAPRVFAETPRTLGILGSGVQAQAHLEALKHVWPERDGLRVWSPTREHAERLAARWGGKATTLEEAAGADVVLTVTSAAQPVLRGAWLKPNSLVLAVGATGATMRELDDETLLGATVIAEARSCVERESGDVRLSGATVAAEIGEILNGSKSGVVTRGKRAVFKTVGMAIEDLTAARLVWERLEAERPASMR